MGRRLTTLVVAAHPDDEILGAGVWIHRQPQNSVHVLTITDGSPRDMENARALGFASRRSYARARREELARALNLAGVPPDNRYRLNFVDKEAYLNLPALIDQLDRRIAALKPDRVLSPAYEGGHPDHDAAAFAVAATGKRGHCFAHWEFPLYHASSRGTMTTGRFISEHASRRELIVSFSRRERLLKSHMLNCFTTQRDILSRFRIRGERFRQAPVYDFSKAPHRGPLLYERWGWSITGEAWRKRAALV